MRKMIWLAVTVALVGSALPARAQETINPRGRNAVNNTNPTFAPGSVTLPKSPTQGIYSGPSGLFSWIPKLNPFRTTTNTINTSTFPREQDKPGMKYLDNFGFKFAQPAQ